jgi:bile acid:Na+ symporter, BASS family
MTGQQIVLLVVQVSIFLTVFGFGLQATRDDLLYLVRRPGMLVRSLVAMFLIMPLFTLIVARTFVFHPAVEIALGALAISPVPPLLPRRQVKAGGEGSYGVGLMATAALLSIAFVPLTLHLLGRFLGLPVAISPAAVARVVMISVLLPLAAGVGFRALAPSFSERVARPVGLIATGLLALGGIAILVGALPIALALIGNGTILVIVAFVAFGLAVGHYLGGPTDEERVVLALSTACRHPALALAIASATFPDEKRVVGAIVLYLLLNLIVAIPYERRARGKVAAA